MADEPGKQLQDLDAELARVAWAALYAGDRGQATFTEDARLRGSSPPWRLIGQVPQAIAADDRLDQGATKAPSIAETPAGLSMVRRANSVDKVDLTAANEADKDTPRSFVRTWIRIVPKNTKELKDKQIDFT